MVCETRSRSKMGGDDDNISKNRVADGERTPISVSKKTGCLGLRRSARETSSKDTSTSPSPTRKSERIQKQTSPINPIKSGRLDRVDTPSPLRRSGRGKRNLLPSSSSSKISEEESTSSGSKTHGKKKKIKKQLVMESEKVSISHEARNKNLSSIGKKRKRLNGHSYKHLLKMRRRMGTPSGVTKSKRPYKFSGANVSDSRNEESKLVEDKENGDDEYHVKDADELTNHLAAHADEGASKDVLEVCPSIETSKILILVDSSSASSENSSESGEHGIIRTSKAHILNTEFEVTVADANMHKFISGSALSPLTGHEKHFFTGPCVACSKQRRVGHDSPKVELCSCVVMSDKDGNNLASPKDGVGGESILISGSAGKYHNRKPEGALSDPHVVRNENVCAVCKQGGKSLLCNGNGCKRCYHPPSSGPPINDVPSGVWHCLWCLKKQIEFGVHSVTKGVESICDAREVDVSGTHRQKQYLVKYIGLAHVHNHWVSEAQLLFEAPSLVANFNDNNQVIRWKSEWTVPYRLLKKRLLSFSKLQGDCQNLDAGDNSECQYEWLVKWQGLGYENATWELEIADCLCSPLGQGLIREYEIRQEKAKQVTSKNNKQSVVRLSEIWDGSSLITDMNILNSVNKLHDHWHKSQNVAFYDDQEQIMKIVLFILSMSTLCCWPVLIITSSHVISQWEAELKKWAPSVDCVVYQGNRETRRIIETLEFFSQGGSIMLQVLLTSLESIVEDIHTLNRLSWEVVVIDQCQHSDVSARVEQIETLAGLKVLLFNGSIKHTASEYLNILSLVDSDGDFDKVDLLKACSNDTLGQMKERVTSPEFLEYWLPVQISELQLELYCDTLLSNIDALCSYSKSDPVGALNDILLNVRKCCDHPYMIFNPSTNPFNKVLSQAEILDIGIQASGKLQLLDKMLCEMKCRQLRTIVFFQSYVGTTTPSIGDILDDFLRQRFGEHSYERVDAFVVRSKNESALNRFNTAENGRFIFLLESRACKPSIKLSSVDNIIIYGSDSNPLNDLKLLEKISYYSVSKQIKVFRLYSCFTVEEQALVVAKQEPDHSHSLSRNLNDTLRWGTSELLSRLDEYHANESHISSEQLLLSVTKEFITIISESSEKVGNSSLISKVRHSSSHFITDLLLFGEQKVKCTGGEEPCVFWKSLLGVRNPQWRHISRKNPRIRKRVQFFDASSQTPETAHNEVVKKCRKTNSGFSAISVPPEHEGDQLSASEEGPSIIRPSNDSLPAPAASENNALTAKHSSTSLCGISSEVPTEIMKLSDKQSSLHIYLKAEMDKVFEVLKLSEDIKTMATQFLEYVIENHRISREPVNIFQAFQISMCWMAASLLKQKVDKDEMLMLTKERLKFKCTKDEATTVYLKLRALKKLFLQHMKRTEHTSYLFNHSEAGKGDTCKTVVQEEHIDDDVLLHEDALNVVVGFEPAAEANCIAQGLPKKIFSAINKNDLTNIEGNQKEVASNSGDVSQTSNKVTSSDDDGLLPQNQCNASHLSEDQSTYIEAGVTGPRNARHEKSSCEAILAENREHQPTSNANGHPPHSEIAYMTCDLDDNDSQIAGPSSQVVEARRITQPLCDADFRDPLHNEFDRLRGEVEHAAKTQEDLRSRLRSDCEKEIEEIVAEIRKKYKARLLEAETRYSVRKNELGGNLKKVLLNKLLADTFRSKCLDLRPSRIPAIPTSFMQHLHQVSIQPNMRSTSLTGLSSAGWQTSAPAHTRAPSVASSSAVEQPSAPASTRWASPGLSSGGQQSATAPSSTALPPASQQYLSVAWLRSLAIASSSAGEQTSAPASTRLPSLDLSSSGQQSATAISKPPAVGESQRRPPSSVALPPASQQNSSTVWPRSPSIDSSSASEQTLAPVSTRLPSHDLSSGGQPPATTAPSIASSPASQQNSSAVWSRSPSIASSSASEQTSVPASTRLQSLALSSGGQQSATAPSKPPAVGESPGRPPSSTALPPSSQQYSSMAWLRSLSIASSSAGEQTSAPASTRLPSLDLSSSGQQSATAPSKVSAVGESPRRQPSSVALPPASQQNSPAVWSRSPSIALSSGGQPVAGQQTSVLSRSSIAGKSPRISNRPPVIGSITPSSGSLRKGGDIRAPAPHLQSFRPSISISAASPSPALSGRPGGNNMVANFPFNLSSLNHAPVLSAAKSSQNSQHKEQQRSRQQPLPANNSESHSRHSEPDNRTSPTANIPHISATELLRNLEGLLGSISANQQNHSGGRQGFCTAPNFSSSSSSINHVLSQPSILGPSNISQDKEQQNPLAATNDFNHVPNQPALNVFPSSALELLRNVDSQALPNQSNDLPSLPETGTKSSVADVSNLETVGSTQGDSTSTPLSTTVADCVSDKED